MQFLLMVVMMSLLYFGFIYVVINDVKFSFGFLFSISLLFIIWYVVFFGIEFFGILNFFLFYLYF